ncbi:replication protein (plasmid) [Rhodococcus pyridinivorans]|uniref:replication protein n=1 Tax=Rhodococcus pyridinivorans TaxID=103816 RepID=UPI0021643488|nr:replication protein [Rhodococcus pyridinivorans]UVT27764.1 replication protein [Rhodococcus pyridinivorans]
MRQIITFARSETGIKICHEHRIAPDKFIAAANAHAAYADEATGRSLTAARATLAEYAGISIDVLDRARQILRRLGAAVELVRGRYLTIAERIEASLTHGGKQLRAASVWALTSKFTVNSSVYPQFPNHADLPENPLGSSGISRSQVLTNARASRRARASTKAGDQPRPLHTQIAAARLADRLAPVLPGCRGVDRQGHYVPNTSHHHIGIIIDTLIDAGIDTTRWTGDAIADRIAEFRRDRTLPHIASPRAFFRWQLRVLAEVWAGPTPTERRAQLQAERASVRESELAHRAANPPASNETRAAAYAKIRRVLASRRTSTSSPSVRNGGPAGRKR